MTLHQFETRDVPETHYTPGHISGIGTDIHRILDGHTECHQASLKDHVYAMIQAYRENIDILTPEFIDDLLGKIKTLDAKYKTLEEMGIDSELGDVFSQVINHEISLCLQKYGKNGYDEGYFQSLVHCANMYGIRLNGIKNLSY